MKFKIHYDEHIERVIVVDAESLEEVEPMIDTLDHSQSHVISSSYEIWAIHELPEVPKPSVNRVE